MMQSPQHRQQMMDQNDTMSDMSEMMNSGMMMDQNMMMQIMKDPQMRNKMIELMKKHVSDMKELLSSNISEDEFNKRMMELLQEIKNQCKNL